MDDIHAAKGFFGALKHLDDLGGLAHIGADEDGFAAIGLDFINDALAAVGVDIYHADGRAFTRQHLRGDFPNSGSRTRYNGRFTGDSIFVHS